MGKSGQRVAPPTSRLHKQGASVNSASSTRSTSSGWRPTNRLLTLIRVDDEGGAQGNAAVLVAHPELVDQGARFIGKAEVVQRAQFGALAAPAQLGVFIVGRTAHQHGIGVGKRFGQLVETGHLTAANGGEVLGIEVDDLPLARKTGLGEVHEGRVAVLFFMQEARLDAHDLEGFQFVADGFHACTHAEKWFESQQG